MAFTYKDFQNALASSGLSGQLSAADLQLAQTNPDVGMSILRYKQDYANAATDELRALANAGAEGVRSSYGNYTAGADGSGYYVNRLSPSSFSSAAAPTYAGSYSGTMQDLLNQQINYGDYSYDRQSPVYDNRHDATIQDLLDQIVNREDFSYDHTQDNLYSQYKKAYTREGDRATQDAVGAAAAASGGIPSSYAATAAAQAGNYYASQLTDKIPELYQLAYNQYMNDHSMKLGDLSAVQGAEQADYSKYLTDLGQYNTDRSFDYGAWLDKYNMINNNLNSASGLEQNDYNKYLNELAQYNTDRSFDYSKLLDEISSQGAERQEALNLATLAAQMGDYSQLNNMGISTDNNSTDWERQYQLALLAAQYGDYSKLGALGITPAAAGGYGGSDGGGGTPLNLSNLPSPDLDANESQYNAIFNKYPDGEVTNQADWQLLVSVYGEDALNAAGWKYSGKQT